MRSIFLAARTASSGQSEKSSFSRPSSVSETMSHETGATREYHGHLVSYEWQSQHAARRAAATDAGGLAAVMKSVITGGLVRAGLVSCSSANPASSPTGIHFNRFFILFNETRQRRKMFPTGTNFFHPPAAGMRFFSRRVSC